MGSGFVAIGDSITRGNTPAVAGVPGKGWVRWVAEASGMPYEQHARAGASASWVVGNMLPDVEGEYAVGTVALGTNDVAVGPFDPNALEAALDAAIVRLLGCCDRVLMLSVPCADSADEVVRRVAVRHGVTVIDGRLRGWRLLRPDGIHPTALGQLELGDRLARELGLPLPSATAPIPGRLEGWYVRSYTWVWAATRIKRRLRPLVQHFR